MALGSFPDLSERSRYIKIANAAIRRGSLTPAEDTELDRIGSEIGIPNEARSLLPQLQKLPRRNSASENGLPEDITEALGGLDDLFAGGDPDVFQTRTANEIVANLESAMRPTEELELSLPEEELEPGPELASSGIPMLDEIMNPGDMPPQEETGGMAFPGDPIPAPIEDEIAGIDTGDVTDPNDTGPPPVARKPTVATEEEAKEESGPAGFSDLLKKAGIVLAGLSAIKGDMNPLNTLLAAQIGKNASERLQEDRKRRQAQQDELFKLKVNKAQLDEWKATKPEFRQVGRQVVAINPVTGANKVIFTGENKIARVDADTGRIFFEDGTSSAIPKTVSEFVQGNTLFRKETFDGQTTVTEVDLTSKGRYQIHSTQAGPVLVEWEKQPDGTFKPNMTNAKAAMEQVLGRARKKEVRDQVETGQKVLQSLPAFKDANAHETAYGAMTRVYTAATDPNSTLERKGAAQITFMNQFQRIVDPATVREGDIALQRSAEAMRDKMGVYYGKIAEGRVISDALMKSMMATATEMLIGIRGIREKVGKEYLESIEGVYDDRAIDSLQEFMSFHLDIPLADLNAGMQIINPDSDEIKKEVEDSLTRYGATTTTEGEKSAIIEELLRFQSMGSLSAQAALESLGFTRE